MTVIMGKNKNSSTHAFRGKFIKREPPIKPPKAPIVCDDPANPANPMEVNPTEINPTEMNPTVTNPTVASLNGSRIINLQNLQQHLQTITNHAALCHSSTDEPSNEQHITVMINEKHIIITYLLV